MGNAQRYFIQLAYHGKNYHGWQTQTNANTVQSELNHAISTILGKQIIVVGCGRTDTGVHAEKFFAHFDVEDDITLASKEKIPGKLNRFLPKDITVTSLFEVLPDANARFSAISRTYEYRITLVKNPFLEELAYYHHGKLDVELMNTGAGIIMEYNDFTTFSKLHTQTVTNNCRIAKAEWQQKDALLVFSISADRFLRNMVRAIVGTLLDLGRGKISTDELRSIIESKNRSNAGMSVPARGLFLVDVIYDEGIFISGIN
jgi:tRNA pseudouridine38-40 synthase